MINEGSKRSIEQSVKLSALRNLVGTRVLCHLAVRKNVNVLGFFNVLQMLMDGRVSMQNVITPLSIFLLLFARWCCCSCSKLRCTYFVSGGDLMLITGNFLKHKTFGLGSCQSD